MPALFQADYIANYYRHFYLTMAKCNTRIRPICFHCISNGCWIISNSKIYKTGGIRMNKFKVTGLKLLAQIAKWQGSTVATKYPSPCIGFLHQPKRPQAKTK